MGAGNSREVKEKLRDITIQERDITETDEVLGKGSYGKVIVVSLYGLRCASKKIHASLTNSLNIGSSNILQRFVGECQNLSKLHHPNIVQFLGVYFMSDREAQDSVVMPALVMELLPIGLGEFLEEYRNVPKYVKTSILYDVSLGLLYLHKQAPPVIHRDLTVNNILLTHSLKAKITDLGVARVLNVKTSRILKGVPQNLYMSICPGTACAMPPEAVVSNALYDTKLDVFSFGHMIIHVAIQRWPMPIPVWGPDPNTPDSTYVIQRNEVQRRQKFITEMGEGHYLKALVTECLKDSPKKRPETEDIVKKLEQINSESPKTPLSHPVELLRALESRLQGSEDADLTPTSTNEGRTLASTGEEAVGLLKRQVRESEQMLRTKDEEIERLRRLLAQKEMTPTTADTPDPGATNRHPAIVLNRPMEDTQTPTHQREQAEAQPLSEPGISIGHLTTLVNGVASAHSSTATSPPQPISGVASSPTHPYEDAEITNRPKPVPRPRSRTAAPLNRVLSPSTPKPHPILSPPLIPAAWEYKKLPAVAQVSYPRTPTNGTTGYLHPWNQPQPIPRAMTVTAANLHLPGPLVRNQAPGDNAIFSRSAGKGVRFEEGMEAGSDSVFDEPQPPPLPPKTRRQTFLPSKVTDPMLEAMLARQRKRIGEGGVTAGYKHLEEATANSPPYVSHTPESGKELTEFERIMQRRRKKSDS